MKRIRERLTYANVVSTLCLLLLLGGGTAYAASTLGKESVGTKEIAKGAVTPPKLSNAAKAALTGKQGPQGPAGQQGPQGIQGIQGIQGNRGEKGKEGEPATALWARVSETSELLNHSPAATEALEIDTGEYEVVFDRDVSGCAYAATPFNNERIASAEPRDDNNDAVYVEITNLSNHEEPGQFYLAVFC
jgi:hypothetical protein